MNPVKLNAFITYFTNYLFCSMGDRAFFNLGLFLSLLSKQMLSMEAMRDICVKQEKECLEHPERC